MKHNVNELARNLLHTGFDSLSRREQNVLHAIAQRRHISRNIDNQYSAQLTYGQHVADQVAAFGGSWTFIIIFAVLLFIWIALNSYILIWWRKPFDPYPYILLNLVLSMLAAIQAPIIMMSQNRQTEKDRLDATHDYEVNLKAELEIMSLHEKMDAIMEQIGRLAPSSQAGDSRREE